MKKPLIAVAAAALLSLAGCATPFAAQVSRFQQMPPPDGQTFTIRASDPHLAGGIEFNMYANMVAQKMEALGYRRAADPANADLVVEMRYSIDDGHAKVVSTPGFYGPYAGPWGYWGRSRFAYGFYDPFLWGPGGGFGGPTVSSYTVYTSELDLDIDRSANGQRLFEGTARAHSADDVLQHVVPPLIEAMFTGFPGNSGEVVKITVEPDRR